MKALTFIFAIGILFALTPIQGMELFKDFVPIVLQIDADNLSSNPLTIKQLAAKCLHVIEPQTTSKDLLINIPLANKNSATEYTHFERLQIHHNGHRKYLINLFTQETTFYARLIRLDSNEAHSIIADDCTSLDQPQKLVFVMDGKGSINRIDFLSIES